MADSIQTRKFGHLVIAIVLQTEAEAETETDASIYHNRALKSRGS